MVKECICGINTRGIAVDDVRKWYRIPGMFAALLIPLLLSVLGPSLSSAVRVMALITAVIAYGYLIVTLTNRMRLGHKLICSIRFAFLTITRV